LARKPLIAMDVLKKEDFLVRLKDTQVWSAMKDKTQSEIDDLLQRLGDEFDRYGGYTTTFFKDRAHLLSLVAGIILALVANIHAGRIFDAFVTNPDLAQRMQAQADQIGAAIQQVKPMDNAQPQGKVDLEKIHTQMKEVQLTLNDYKKLGLPIGWAYYPNCLGDGKNDPRCKDVREQGDAKENTTTPSTATAANQTAEPEKETDDGTKGSIAGLIASLGHTLTKDLIGFVQWFGGLLLTGLLIGLGGPFWYDLASKLAELLALFKGKTPVNAPDKNAGKAA